MSRVCVSTGRQAFVCQTSELTPARLPRPGQARQPSATWLNTRIWGGWNSCSPATVTPEASRRCTAHGVRLTPVANRGRWLCGPVWEAPRTLKEATRNTAVGRWAVAAARAAVATGDALEATPRGLTRPAGSAAADRCVVGRAVGCGAGTRVCPGLGGGVESGAVAGAASGWGRVASRGTGTAAGSRVVCGPEPGRP